MNMHVNEYTIPSKTFLIGEYAALYQGPAIVVATSPAFVIRQNQLPYFAAHPESPAGRLNKSIYFSISDPHNGSGGFGKSTAEFLATCLQDDHNLENDTLLGWYRSVHDKPSGYKPSGYDLLCQWHGGVCLFEHGEVSSLPWAFPGCALLILATGFKENTHEHLARLTEFDPTKLITISQAACLAYQRGDQEGFLATVRAYAQALEVLNLCDSHTQQMLALLNNHPAIWAAKGCGSMGRDVMIVLCDRKEKNKVLSYVKKIGLHPIADDEQIHHGTHQEIRRSSNVVFSGTV